MATVEHQRTEALLVLPNLDLSHLGKSKATVTVGPGPSTGVTGAMATVIGCASACRPASWAWLCGRF